MKDRHGGHGYFLSVMPHVGNDGLQDHDVAVDPGAPGVMPQRLERGVELRGGITDRIAPGQCVGVAEAKRGVRCEYGRETVCILVLDVVRIERASPANHVVTRAACILRQDGSPVEWLS